MKGSARHCEHPEEKQHERNQTVRILQQDFLVYLRLWWVLGCCRTWGRRSPENVFFYSLVQGGGPCNLLYR